MTPNSSRRLGSGSLVIATHNAGKLKEISALLAPYGVNCISAGSLGLPEPAETGVTFAQNALIKARAAAEASGLAALADDSGIEVEGLGGAALGEVEQLVAREDAPRPLGEGGQQVELAGGELDVAAIRRGHRERTGHQIAGHLVIDSQGVARVVRTCCS